MREKIDIVKTKSRLAFVKANLNGNVNICRTLKNNNKKSLKYKQVSKKTFKTFWGRKVFF